MAFSNQSRRATGWRTARALAAGLASGAILLACDAPKGEETVQAGTFTLETGVELSDLPACGADDTKAAPTIEKSGASYVVRFRDFFPCDADLRKPYLTERGDNQATLVFWNGDKYRGGCECSRSLTVTITGRLHPGNMLYVLNDHDVLGHLVVP